MTGDLYFRPEGDDMKLFFEGLLGERKKDRYDTQDVVRNGNS